MDRLDKSLGRIYDLAHMSHCKNSFQEDSTVCGDDARFSKERAIWPRNRSFSTMTHLAA